MRPQTFCTQQFKSASEPAYTLNFWIPKANKSNLSHLENITNSRKDLVGKAKLNMTDHVSPSSGMDGKESKSCLMPYILLKASEKANLQSPTIKWWKSARRMQMRKERNCQDSHDKSWYKQHSSYLQFPAFIASQKDQKSLLKWLLGSMSMGTQK